MSKRPAEPYVSVTRDLMASPAYMTLSDPAIRLLHDVRYQLNGFNNGRLLVTLRVLRHRGWNSSSKLVRACAEVMAHGILRQTRHCPRNTKMRASLYGFTDLPIFAYEKEGVAGRQPTRDYNEWKPGVVIFASRQEESCDTSKRKAAIPAGGKLCVISSLGEGKQENERDRLMAKANLTNAAEVAQLSS